MSVKALFKGEPLYLMDGSAFVYRGFYANQTLARSDGFPTGALLVVTRILLRILREEAPTRFVMVLDGKGPTFRHDLYPDYKAQRKTTPEGLVMQLEPIRNVTKALGLPLVVSEGCEADDCIASLAHHFAADGVVIVGADKDLRQCLTEQVIMWDPATKDGKVTTKELFVQETGLQPSQWPDVQAIIGDSSDNIPGVPGVGVKTAEKIFQSFASLEDIRQHFDALPPAVRKKMDGHQDAILLYRELTRLKTDCCTTMSEADLNVQPVDVRAVTALLREFELTSLERDLARAIGDGRIHAVGASVATSASALQGSLLETIRPQDRLVASTPEALPAFAGKTVAIMPGENEIGIACAGEEWQYTGTTPGLVGVLARALASSSRTRLCTPDLKRLLHMHPAWRALPTTRWFDLGLASYLLDPEQQDYGWPRLAGEWGTALGLPAANPGLLALSMSEQLHTRLEAAGLLSLFNELELPLAPVLADMEASGVRLDVEKLSVFLTSVKENLESLTQRIYAAAGGPFNIRSAQQLGEVLFKRLNLPTAGKTSGGQASTSKDVLESLSGRHPVVDALREYRVLEKLRSTYLEPLPRLMGDDERIRTTFNQTATATGRLSSSNPNLQNIPVRGEQGRRMRACFTAAEGHALISADYSQIELRVLACVSGDPTLLAAFREGADIHARTAGLLYGCAPEDITPDQRRAAKTINFGLIYGMGAQKLGHDLGVSMAEARAFIQRYFEHLSVLREFYATVKAEAREHGYVTTLTGRRRLLPGIASASAPVRALAERQAVNTVIQGSAADIIKLAMLSVSRDQTLRSLDACLLLQIHDELLLEVPEATAHAAGQRVAELMEGVTPAGKPLDVALQVDWGVGHNWGEAH